MREVRESGRKPGDSRDYVKPVPPMLIAALGSAIASWVFGASVVTLILAVLIVALVVMKHMDKCQDVD